MDEIDDLNERDNDFEMEVSRLPASDGGYTQQPCLDWLARHTRPLGAAFLAGLVGLVVLLLLAGALNGQPGASALRALFAPAPTATIPTSATVIKVVNWAPWGTLLANGRPIAQLSAPRNPTRPPALPAYVTTFLLPPGRYTLEYHAAPFPGIRCQISVPAAGSDTCPLAPGAYSGPSPSFAQGARVLDLHAAPEYLDSDAYAELVAAVSAFLAASNTQWTFLQPGEHYLDAQRQVTTARESLQVSAVFTPRVDLGAPYPARGCTVICAGPLVDGALLTSGDNILSTWMGANVQARLAYRYTTMDGQVILDHAPISQHSFQYFTLPIALAWRSGAWHVALQKLGNAVDTCPLALGDLNYGLAQDSPASAILRTSHPLLNWMDGCMLDVAVSGVGGNVTVPLLFRCGVALALSPQARQVFTTLPLATPSERQVADQAFSS